MTFADMSLVLGDPMRKSDLKEAVGPALDAVAPLTPYTRLIRSSPRFRSFSQKTVRHSGAGATRWPGGAGFKIRDGLHHQNRQEVSSRGLSISLQKPDQDDPQRGTGERLHCLQGLPAAAVTGIGPLFFATT